MLNKEFRDGIKDTDIINLFNFDHKLRMEVFYCIGKIELYVRSLVSYTAIELHGENWLLNDSLFDNNNNISSIRSKIANQENKDVLELNSHDFLNNLTIGQLLIITKTFNDRYLIDFIKDEIGATSKTCFLNWLEVLRQIRNICAHHGRLWNRTLLIPKTIMNSLVEPYLPSIVTSTNKRRKNRLYLTLLMINYIFMSMKEDYSIKKNLRRLLNEYDIKDYVFVNSGFPFHWYNNDIWLT